MPFHLIENRPVVLPDFDFSDKYWPIISKFFSGKYGEEEISIQGDVHTRLIDCFQYWTQLFKVRIEQEKRASFYIYLHNIHEYSVELWSQQLNGLDLKEYSEDFASSRRVMKIILEQSCGLKLVGAQSFPEEIANNKTEYVRILEELLYLGYWSIVFSELISRNKLFPKSIGLKIENGLLNILTYQPYPHLYSFVINDLNRHNSFVQITNSIIEFKKVFQEEMSLDFDTLASATGEQLDNPILKTGLLKIEEIINQLSQKFGFNKEQLSDFYDGLTVHAENFMTIEDCIIRNQDIRRHVYRPILKINVDNMDYNIFGVQKWSESITTMSTNALPFGICPEEWMKYPGVKKFINSLGDKNDKVLEDPVVAIIESQNLMYDRSVVSLQTKGGNYVKVDIPGVGEIDVIFIDEEKKIVYVLECKHNRSRFDITNWIRDYSNFKSKYEKQLDNKVGWVEEKLNIVVEHFAIKYERELDFTEYSVIGVFSINAPTIYMHNGKYRALTIRDVNDLVEGNYINHIFEFRNEETGEIFQINHPYFEELEKHLKK